VNAAARRAFVALINLNAENAYEVTIRARQAPQEPLLLVGHSRPGHTK
jgi:hypothetical protein